MSDFKIKIETTSDNKGVDSAKGSLANLKAQAIGLKTAYTEAGGGIRGMFAAISGGGAVAMAALAAVTAALYAAGKAIAEFAQAEKEVASLNTALAQTGQFSRETSIGLQELADALEDTTGVGDDQWLKVFTELLQSGSTVEGLQQHADAVKNLAGILDGDLSTASHLVSKAVMGNFEAFARYNIIVSEAATESEKLDRLYEQLARRGGGQLEARTQTLSGSFGQLSNATGDFFKAIGRLIAQTGVLQGVLYSAAESIKWITSLFGGSIEPIEGMANATDSAAIATDRAKTATRRYSEELDAQKKKIEANSQALSYQISVLRSKKRIEDEMSDAQMALKLAIVDEREARKKITRMEALEQRAKIRADAAEEKYKRDAEFLIEEKKRTDAFVQANTEQAQAAEREAAEKERLLMEFQDAEARRNAAEARFQNDQMYWRDQRWLARENPEAYSNPEIGVSPGLRSKKDWEAIEATFDRQLALAEARKKEALANIPQAPPQSAVDTAEARKAVDKQKKELANQNQPLIQRSQELAMEIEAAQKLHDLRQRTAHVETRTEKFTQNQEDRKRKLNNDNSLSDQVLPLEKLKSKEAQQLQKIIEAINSSIDQGYQQGEMLDKAVQRIRQLEIYIKQLENRL